MTDNKATLDRLLRIEQRIGVARADRLPVLIVAANETNEQALQRAAKAGYTSVGLVLPDDLSEDEWERQAREHFAKRNGGNDA